VDLLILILTCAVNLILGILVLMRDSRKSYSQLFMIITVLTSTWIVTNYITNHAIHDLGLASIANNLAFASGYAVVLSALMFSYVFPVRRKIGSFEKWFLIFSSAAILVLSMTELIAGEVTIEGGKLAFSVGGLLWLFVVGFVGIVCLTARNLLRLPGTPSRSRIRQAKLILFAFGTTALAGLILNAIVPLIWANWDATRFGPLMTIILVATIAYTIVRHGLFDIRLAVVRGATYVLSLLTLAAVYYLVAYAVSWTFINNDTVYIDPGPFNILLALLLAFIFQPIKHFFDRLTNQVFYRDNYRADEFFASLSRALSMSTDLRNLLQSAVDVIDDTIKAEYTFFYVRYGDDRHMSIGTRHHGRVYQQDVNALDDFVETHGQTIIVTDTLDESDPLYRLLNRHEIALTLPLLQGERILGYLFLGSQRSRDYTRRDIRALETISDELVIAIQNAQSVQEVKEINETLQQRIQDATKELRQSNMQLQRLDTAKDEFVSMASHQLRTPLTSVKGYISMVLEGDVGRITATQRQLLSEAFTSSERMVHLINDFLNVSRLQTGKFMLESKPIDLSKLILQEVDSLRTTAEAHSLTLSYKAPSYFPTLYLDEGKIRQVAMNFIDNAIYYSREGTTITVSLSVQDGDAILEVHDTGIGVPASEQAHLFTKFFRATNARKQRPDGTGVGLFLAKKVIVAHGGSMVFSSVEGEGSTFGFRLPIKRLSSAPDDTEKLEK